MISEVFSSLMRLIFPLSSKNSQSHLKIKMQLFSSCSSNLFVCTAFLCWDYLNLSYSFSNVSDCSPNPIEFFEEKIFLPSNNLKSSSTGFVCSNCSQNHLIKASRTTSIRCENSSIRIQFESFCWNFYPIRNDDDRCRCLPSKTPIERLHIWNQVEMKSGKSNLNPRKSQEINQSSSSVVFFLFGLLLFIVLFGGFIGLVSFYIQTKRRKK